MSRHTGCICFAQQYRNNVIQGSLTILCIFSLAKLVAHAKVATAQKNTEGRTSACYVLAPLQRTTCQIQAKRTIVIARLVSTNEWFPRLLRVAKNVIKHEAKRILAKSKRAGTCIFRTSGFLCPHQNCVL